MNPALKLSLMFDLGLLIQSVFLIRGNLKENILRWLKAFIASFSLAAIIFLPVIFDESKKISISDIYLFLFWFYLLFSFFFTGAFFYKALYEINEKILLVWTLIFWYAYAVNYDPVNWLSIVFLIPTFIVLIAGFAPAHMDYFWKSFLYAWFLFVLLFLIFIQFKSSFLNFIFAPGKIAVSYGLFSAFSAGMVFLTALVYGSHLLAFLPVKSKYEHWSSRLREIGEHAFNVSAKYSNYQMSFIEASLITVLIGGIFLGNYHFKVAPSDLVINLGIIGSFLYSERPMRRGA